jgi:hypothetical protein
VRLVAIHVFICIVQSLFVEAGVTLTDEVNEYTELTITHIKDVISVQGVLRALSSNTALIKREYSQKHNLFRKDVTVFARVICAPAYFAQPNF